MFTDRELTGVVVLLIVVDVVVMSLWTGVDRPRIVTVTLPSQVGQVYVSKLYFENGAIYGIYRS